MTHQFASALEPLHRRDTRRRTSRVADCAPGRLPAKLRRPSPKGALVRERLFALLDELTEQPVTWLHAPAGGGKTTLLATYLEGRRDVLWYAADAGDADSSSFFHYLRLAAQALDAGELEVPSSRAASPAAQRASVRRFFEDLIVALPRAALIVFDDYHEVAAQPEWHEIFRELCSAATEDVRVIVASRSAPSPLLTRFLAARTLAVLDEDALRLNQEEVRELLRRSGQTSEALLDELSRQMAAITNGWPAGVALLSIGAAAASQTVQRTNASLLASSAFEPGELRAVFNYLASEVLDRLDPATRRVLLELAVFPSFSASMATTHTRRRDMPQLLSRLHAERLFIERHGETHYRFHELFRLLLLDRARAELDEVVGREQRSRAALLLASDDQLQPACELLTEAEDFDSLSSLLEGKAPELAAQGRLSALRFCLERIPETTRRQRAWLTYWEAVTCLGRPGRSALELSRAAFESFRQQGDERGVWLSWALAIRAIELEAENYARCREWLALEGELAHAPPGPAEATQVAISRMLALSYCEMGTPRCIDAADTALALVSTHGSREDRLRTAASATLIYLFSGHVGRARELCNAAGAEYQRAGRDPLARLSHLQSDAMLCLWSEADFERCLRAVDEGIALGQASGIEAWHGSLLVLGVLAAIAGRDLGRADRYLAAMSRFAPLGPCFARAQYAFGRSWLALERGKVHEALSFARDSLNENRALGFGFATAQSELAEFMCQVAQGALRPEVDASLERLQAAAVAIPSPIVQASVHLAKALAWLERGLDAAGDLESGFALLRQHDLRASAFFGPRAMLHLLTEALRRDIETEFCHDLLSRHRLRPGPDVLSSKWPWRIKVRALCALEIEIDERPVSFNKKKPTVPLALLKLLVLHDEPLPMKRLASALWPAYDELAGRAALDTALYRLRKILAVEDAIENTSGAIALNRDVVWTDVRALSQCARQAAAFDAVERERCASILRDIHERGFIDEDEPIAIERERRRVERRFAQILRRDQGLTDACTCDAPS